MEFSWKDQLFWQYRHDDPGSNLNASGELRTQGADINFLSAGAIQYIKAADAMLYLLYQHADGDLEANLASGLTNVQIDSFQQVIGGVRIAF